MVVYSGESAAFPSERGKKWTEAVEAARGCGGHSAPDQGPWSTDGETQKDGNWE